MANDLHHVRAASVVAHNPIVVTVPTSAAFDRVKMEKILRDILGRVGCPECHSGWDIRFRVERNFFVDDQLQIRPAFSEPMPGIRG